MKYLIYCGPGIGDMILILPMVKNIKQNDPRAYIHLLICSDKNRVKITEEMKRLQDDTAEVSYYSMKELKHSLKGVLQRGFKTYDYGFVLQYTANSNTSLWPQRLVSFAAKQCIGIDLLGKSNYDVCVPFQKHQRIVEYSYQMLEKIGFDVKREEDAVLNPEKVLPYLPEELVSRDKNRLCIALCIGTARVGMKIDGKPMSSDNKCWPYPYWCSLAMMLAEKNHQVLLLGGKKEKEEFAQSEVYPHHHNIIDLIGKCNISQSFASLTQCNLVVGADTGLMHCAGAVGVPSLTLFGCTDPKEYLAFGKHSYYLTAGEECSPCFGTPQAVLCQTRNCMKHITPEQVERRVYELLEARTEEI